ncbi:uncharacterized [Tachysurus ichikawai]
MIGSSSGGLDAARADATNSFLNPSLILLSLHVIRQCRFTPLGSSSGLVGWRESEAGKVKEGYVYVLGKRRGQSVPWLLESLENMSDCGSGPCLAAWHSRAAQWPLRLLGLGVKACGGHCYPPCMGAYVRLHSNDYPRQVVYGDSGLEDQDKSAHRGSFPKLSMRDRIATR